LGIGVSDPSHKGFLATPRQNKNGKALAESEADVSLRPGACLAFNDD
jgi:hypothetical protein